MTENTPKPRRTAAIITGSIFGVLAASWLVIGQIDDKRSAENMLAFKNMSRMTGASKDPLPIEFFDITELIQRQHASRIEAAALVKLTKSRTLLCEEARGFVHRSMKSGNADRPERMGKTITKREYLPAAAVDICEFALKVVKNPKDYVDDNA